MLTELRIENFAIIQKLELHPGEGLLIFTGETGAGKSIILDALMALVGGKVDGTMVRQGDERATLEAVFSIPAACRAEVNEILNREDLLEDEPYLTLSREIRMGGRSVARVNGRSVNVGLLKELGSLLVDIHGQSEHLSLLNVHSHLALLDRYAGCDQERENYQAYYRSLQQVRKQLKSLRELELESSRRLELLTFQAQEIETARLEVGEEEQLENERIRLANAEALATNAQQALTILDEGSPEDASALDLLGQASKILATLARIDAQQTQLTDQLEGASAALSEISRDLRGYLDGLEFNPKRLEQVENRLELIHLLQRKYGASTEAVMAYGKAAREELERVQNAGEHILELEKEEADVRRQALQAGYELSRVRRQAAEKISREVEAELNDLSLKGARFEVSFNTLEKFADDDDRLIESIELHDAGLDEAEFLIAPNPGEGLKPLVKIASGGETSRLMLALKNVLAQADHIPTLIFDEIDQGIGGRVGFVVGEKMWHLARCHQVMCVTHLSQLAAFGDEHYKVEKQVVDERTVTNVTRLDGEQRIYELALMNGNASDSNLAAAREILQRANGRQASVEPIPDN